MPRHSTLHHGCSGDAAGVRVDASAPSADSDAAGLLQIRVAADGPAAAQAVAALAAGAVKGALPGGELPIQMPCICLLSVTCAGLEAALPLFQ